MSASRMRLLVELIRVVEPGRVVHRDLGAEAAVAQVRPVADLAVADAHEVGEAVAATCRRDRSTACRRRRPGAGPCSSSDRLADALRPGRKPSSASDGCQVKTSSSVMRTSAWPSPSRSTNLRLGSPQSTFGQRTRTGGTAPSSSLVRALVEARRRAIEARRDRAGRRRRDRGTAGAPLRLADEGVVATQFERGEARDSGFFGADLRPAAGAEVALVEPAAGLLGEDAGEPFAVQIDPLVAAAVETDGQILQAVGDRLREPSS